MHACGVFKAQASDPAGMSLQHHRTADEAMCLDRGKLAQALKVLQKIRGPGVNVRPEFDEIVSAVENARQVNFWALLNKIKYRGVLVSFALLASP